MRIPVLIVAAALVVAACGSTATPAPASVAPASPAGSTGASPSSGSSGGSPASSPSAGALASIGALASGSFALPSGISASGSAAAALSAISQFIQQQAGSSATPPTWMSEITGASMSGSTLVIQTNQTSKTSDVTTMCNALSSAVFGGASAAGVTGFDIQGPGGQSLDTKTSASGTC